MSLVKGDVGVTAFEGKQFIYNCALPHPCLLNKDIPYVMLALDYDFGCTKIILHYKSRCLGIPRSGVTENWTLVTPLISPALAARKYPESVLATLRNPWTTSRGGKGCFSIFPPIFSPPIFSAMPRP